MIILEVDESITLRTLSLANSKRLFEITNNSRDYLQKWLPWLDQTKTESDSESFIKVCFELFSNREALLTGIFYKEELVGMAGFNSFDWKNKIGYIGYWLDQDMQGQGIMTSVISALTDYGFEELGLNKLDLRCAYENTRSQKIPNRLGFKLEGHLRQAEWLYDHYVDHLVYGMIKVDWENEL